MKTTPINRSNIWHFAMLALVTASTSLYAQTVTMRSQPLRITVPKGVAYSNFTTLTITTASLGTPLVNLAVTGIPGSGNANAWLSQTAITSNAANFTVTLIYTNDSTIGTGTYDMAVEATGDASFRLPIPVICNYIWSGASFTNGTSTNWATAGNWQGGIAPGASDDVAFREMGAVTNAANGATAQLNTPDIATNVIVSANTTVGSIRFAQNSVTNQAFHVEIQSGATLSVTGPNGFRIMRDAKFSGTQFGAKFSGGGKLLVSHPSAVVAHLLDAQPAVALWDMRALNNFEANVSRLALGDYREFSNYYTNGSVGTGSTEPSFASRFMPHIYLALTNVIKASYVDPDNYFNLGVRNYALTLGNNEAQGSTVVQRFELGLSNAFFLDSICFAQSGSGANPNLYIFNASNSYALFRGTGGMSSRMTVWVQGDPAGTNNSTSATRGNTVDFRDGKVDALVDRLYLSRFRTNTAGQTVQSTLTIGGATPGSLFDVNDVILGYQEADNLGTGAALITTAGTLNVNSNATLIVNKSLQLGYTTATTTGLPSYPDSCSGTLNVTSNGTAMVSNILAGGVSNKSINNNVRVSGGRLIITNGIGTATAPINNLSITNGARLTLHNVALGNTNIFVKTFTAPVNGPAVLVNVPVLTNTIWPITIGVISYASGTPSYGGLVAGQLPSGVVLQSIVDSGAGPGVITFTFTTNQPKVLVWRGNTAGQSGTWDTIQTNWVTQIGNTPSRFTDGDSVVFDDTLTGSANITNAGNVVPGSTAATYGIVVSNSANNYTFYGDSVLGGAGVSKVGTSALTINNTFNPGVNVTGGSLSGSGSVGSAILGTGTTMTGFSGTIGGSLEASNANVSVTGTVNGGLALREGSLTNSATGTIWGTASVTSTNAYLLNLGTMNITVPWSIPTNSILVNNGTITQNGPGGQNLGLTVNGKLRGVGKITQPGSGTNATSDVRVTIGAGGTLDIGNVPNEITNMTIAVRLDVNATSVTTFDVDNTGTPVNDKIILTDPFVSLGKVNFGVGNNLGGTLFINRIAGGAFNGATTIYPFDLTSNSPDNSQPAIPQIIPAPGGGLTWNTAVVISNLTLTVTSRPAMTNYVAKNPTNGTVSLVFSWPADFRGWRLERQSQTNALDAGNVGLESPSTNWTTVFTGLGGTNSLYFPDITNAPNDFYYRSVQTISTTNDGVSFPAAFFRLNYP